MEYDSKKKGDTRISKSKNFLICNNCYGIFLQIRIYYNHSNEITEKTIQMQEKDVFCRTAFSAEFQK